MATGPESAHDITPTAAEDQAAALKSAHARIAYLEGQVEAFRSQIAALESTDEHRHGELTAAQAEAADAQARTRELQARAEERQHLVEELRDRLKSALDDKARADQERAAVIASLGWRAKRKLNDTAG